MEMPSPEQIFENANSILLVDWPDSGVPRTLVHAGFKVFCFSPNGYTEAAIVAVPPKDLDQGHIFPPASQEEKGYLILRPMNHPPASVDIVTIYRPTEEHEGIIKNQVLPLGAKLVWLQPPIESDEIQQFAKQWGLTVILGKDIREIARLRIKRKNLK
jgi:predicted CoA-binding protein